MSCVGRMAWRYMYRWSEGLLERLKFAAQPAVNHYQFTSFCAGKGLKRSVSFRNALASLPMISINGPMVSIPISGRYKFKSHACGDHNLRLDHSSLQRLLSDLIFFTSCGDYPSIMRKLSSGKKSAVTNSASAFNSMKYEHIYVSIPRWSNSEVLFV